MTRWLNSTEYPADTTECSGARTHTPMSAMEAPRARTHAPMPPVDAPRSRTHTPMPATHRPVPWMESPTPAAPPPVPRTGAPTPGIGTPSGRTGTPVPATHPPVPRNRRASARHRHSRRPHAHTNPQDRHASPDHWRLSVRRLARQSAALAHPSQRSACGSARCMDQPRRLAFRSRALAREFRRWVRQSAAPARHSQRSACGSARCIHQPKRLAAHRVRGTPARRLSPRQEIPHLGIRRSTTLRPTAARGQVSRCWLRPRPAERRGAALGHGYAGRKRPSNLVLRLRLTASRTPSAGSPAARHRARPARP